MYSIAKYNNEHSVGKKEKLQKAAESEGFFFVFVFVLL